MPRKALPDKGKPKRKAIPDKNKLKRMRLEKQIGNQPIDEYLEGPVHEVLESITKLHMEAAVRGWKDIRIFHEGFYDSAQYELWGTRLETDAEMKKRFASIRKRRETAAEKKAVEEFKKQRSKSL